MHWLFLHCPRALIFECLWAKHHICIKWYWNWVSSSWNCVSSLNCLNFHYSKQVLLLCQDWVRPPELQCFHTLPVQRGDLSRQEPERHAEALSLNWRWQLCQIWWEADGLDGIKTDEMRHKHTYTLQDRAGPQLGHCPGQTNIKFVKYFFFCFDGNTISETAWTRWILLLNSFGFTNEIFTIKDRVQSAQVHFLLLLSHIDVKIPILNLI